MGILETLLVDAGSLAYLFNLAVAACLLASAGLVAASVCRRRGAPLRHGILLATLTLILLSPGTIWLAQNSGLVLMSIALSGQSTPTETQPSESHDYDATQHQLKPLFGSTSTEFNSEQNSSWLNGADRSTNLPAAGMDCSDDGPAIVQSSNRPSGAYRAGLVRWQVVGTLLAYAWVLGVIVGSFRFSWGYRVLSGFCATLELVAESRVKRLAQQAASAVRLRNPPPVFISSAAAAPLCLGIIRQAVVLPEEILWDLDDEQIHDVLIHEMAHIARRDPGVGLAAQIGVLLFWWNPLVYRLRDTIAEVREDICDNYVCLAGGNSSRFAETLVELAACALSRRIPPTAVGIVDPHGLIGRVTRLLSSDRILSTRMSLASRLTVTICALSGLFITTLLCGLKTAHSEQSSKVDTKSAVTEQSDQIEKKDVPIDKDAPIAVAGKVVDADGNPIAGARLVVSGTNITGVRATSNAQGEFAFNMKRDEFGLNDSGNTLVFSKIIALADGYGLDFQAAYCFDPSGRLARGLATSPFPSGDQCDRTLRLVHDDVPVGGRIVDSKGQPVAAATVRVDSIWIPKAEDLTPFLLAIEAGEDYDIAVLEMMDRVVHMGETMGSAITESDGTFRLPGGIGRERLAMVKISGPNIVSERVFVRTRPGSLLRAPHIVESPDGGNFRFFGSTFDFTARPSIPIAGLVRDQVTGQPVPGISVRFMANGRDQNLMMELDQIAVRAVTDEAGRYRLVGAPLGSDHTILAISAGQPYLPAARQTKAVQEDVSANVDFLLAKGIKIEGRIIDGETSEPVPANVMYFASVDNPLCRAAPDFNGAMAPIWPNDSGEYTVAGLSGRGWIAIRAKDERRYARGIGPAETTEKHAEWPTVFLPAYPAFLIPENYTYVVEVEIGPNVETYHHDIVLPPQERIEGTVLDPQGKPLAGATYGGLTDGDGPYFRLATHRFSVNAYKGDKPRQLLFVHRQRRLAGSLLLEGPQEGAITVQLEPWGTVSGRIIDAGGKPRAKSLIRGWAPGHGNRAGYGELPERHFWTDDQGRFQIEGLAPNLKYELEVIENGEIIATTANDIALESGENRDLGDVRIDYRVK